MPVLRAFISSIVENWVMLTLEILSAQSYTVDAKNASPAPFTELIDSLQKGRCQNKLQLFLLLSSHSINKID